MDEKANNFDPKIDDEKPFPSIAFEIGFVVPYAFYKSEMISYSGKEVLSKGRFKLSGKKSNLQKGGELGR